MGNHGGGVPLKLEGNVTGNTALTSLRNAGVPQRRRRHPTMTSTGVSRSRQRSKRWKVVTNLDGYGSGLNYVE